jgi:hypothetical protein
MQRIETPARGEGQDGKGENSCEPGRTFGAGNLLGMRRMPLGALSLFGGVF